MSENVVLSETGEGSTSQITDKNAGAQEVNQITEGACFLHEQNKHWNE